MRRIADMRKGQWLSVVIPAAVVSAYAAAALLVPSFRPPLVRARLHVIPWAVVGHLSGGALALLAGAFQVNARLRARFLAVHRWVGRLYVAAVAIGGAGALVMATRSDGGLVTHVGFGLLAVLWLLTTALSYRAIRGGDHVGHRRWMLRSYALTFAAVTLRLYLPIALTAGLPFINAYQAISWACWVPNLIFVEWWLLRPSSARVAPVTAGA
ncbi:MAG TPA: DUF2306 domain-containing protein [Vicinamibacterales bacterium]